MKHPSKRNSATKKAAKKKQQTAKSFHDIHVTCLNSLKYKLDSSDIRNPKEYMSLQILLADELISYGESLAKRFTTNKAQRDHHLELFVKQRKVLADYARSYKHG